MARSNNWADKRNFVQSEVKTDRGVSGTTLTVGLNFATAGSVGITLLGVTGGGFKSVTVVLADHHDNEVGLRATTANVSTASVKDISGFSKSDDLRVRVFAVKSNEATTEENPLLATSQPDQLIARSKVDSLATVSVDFIY